MCFSYAEMLLIVLKKMKLTCPNSLEQTKKKKIHLPLPTLCFPNLMKVVNMSGRFFYKSSGSSHCYLLTF